MRATLGTKRMNLIVYCQTAATKQGNMEYEAVSIANEMSVRGHAVTFVYEFAKGCYHSTYALNEEVKILPWHVSFPAEIFSRKLAGLSADVALIFYSNKESIVRPFKLLANGNLPIVLHEEANSDKMGTIWHSKSAFSKNLLERKAFQSAATYIHLTKTSYIKTVKVDNSKRVVSFMKAFEGKKNLLLKERGLLEVFFQKMQQKYKIAKPDKTKTFRILHINETDNYNKLLPLLNAFAIASKGYTNWQLHFVGKNLIDLAFHETIQDIFEKYNLKGKVFFRKMDDNVAIELASADINVNICQANLSSNLIIETMRNSVPTIGHNLRIGPNFVLQDHKNGIVLHRDVNDVRELTAALVKFMGNLSMLEKLGEQAQRDAEIIDITKTITMDFWETLLTKASLEAGFGSHIIPENLDRQMEGYVKALNQVGISVEPTKIPAISNSIASNCEISILYILTNAYLGSLGTTGTYEVIRQVSKRYKVKVISRPRPDTVEFDDREFNVDYVQAKLIESALEKTIIENEINIVHLYRGGDGEFNLVKKIRAIGKKNNLDIKIVYDIKSPILKSEEEKATLRFDIQKTVGLIDHIISLSDFTINHNIPMIAVPYTIIPLGVMLPDNIEIQPIEISSNQLIYIGSMAKKRNLYSVVKWFANFLKQQTSELTLHLYGRGDDVERIDEFIKSNELENNIKIMGFMPQSELFAKMGKYDAGIAYVPDDESFSGSPSLKSIEYAAGGIPILSTATIAHKEYAKFYGLEMTFFEDNEKSFHQALRKIPEKEEKRQIIENNLKSIQGLSYSNIVTNHIEPVYTELFVDIQNARQEVYRNKMICEIQEK